MNNFNHRDIQTMVKAVINEVYSRQKDVLEEGKRDNQLLPYLNLYNEKTGKNISLGEFKTMMLRKLSFEGGMRNISLQSNYYLAGAVRYYFEGLLTTTPELGILTDSMDTWNLKVCTKLNALVLALRNGYIDSVGTTWLEPEDFGTLSLKELFSKYAKEIRKVLNANKEAKQTEPEKVEQFVDYSIPNGDYTYDIVYNYAIASKYKDYTAPGSWCITYASNMLRSYTSAGHGHFVIFRKNGFEEVPRKIEKDKWVGLKPQDDYGNSLIAYLQSDTNPGPANYHGAPLITSRWNHGYEESCEADRAYTQEEFQKITGVSDEDLKGIYNTWKHWKDIKGDNNEENSNVIVKPTQDDIRALKYIQMRINGGESPETLIEFYSPSTLVQICRIKLNERYLYFVTIGKKILFETTVVGDKLYTVSETNALLLFKNRATQKYFLLNKRLKSLVYIEGAYLFKKAVLHNNIDVADDEFLEVKQANMEIALVDGKTGIPLKLPNGHYWFNEIYDARGNTSEKTGKVRAAYHEKKGILELVYDLSSGEKYFYDCSKGKFVDFGQNRGETVYHYADIFGSKIQAMVVGGSDVRTDWGYYYNIENCKQLLYKDGSPYSIVFNVNGKTYKIGDNGPEDATRIPFTDIRPISSKICDNVLILLRDNNTSSYSEVPCVVYNGIKESLMPTIDGSEVKILMKSDYSYYSSGLECFFERFIGFKSGHEEVYEYNVYNIYDCVEDKYLENPYSFPSKYEFVYPISHVDYKDNDYLCFLIDGFMGWREFRQTYPDKNYWHEKTKYERYYCINDSKCYIQREGQTANGREEFIEDTNVNNQESNTQEPAYSLTEQDIIDMVSRVTSILNETNKIRPWKGNPSQVDLDWGEVRKQDKEYNDSLSAGEPKADTLKMYREKNPTIGQAKIDKFQKELTKKLQQKANDSEKTNDEVLSSVVGFNPKKEKVINDLKNYGLGIVEVTGKTFANGNTKLPPSMLVINITSSLACPISDCPISKKCYAKKISNRYDDTEMRDIRNMVAYQYMDIKDILGLVETYIENAPTKIRYIRLNEAGDFQTQEQVDLIDKIAGHLKAKYGIVTAAYTRARTLDFTNVKNIIINSSDARVLGADRLYFPINKDIFNKIPDDGGIVTIPIKGKDVPVFKCHCDCHQCKFCYQTREQNGETGDTLTRVYVKFH